MISHRTRFERFRQKVTKLDTAKRMGAVKKKKECQEQREIPKREKGWNGMADPYERDQMEKRGERIRLGK